MSFRDVGERRVNEASKSSQNSGVTVAAPRSTEPRDRSLNWERQGPPWRLTR